MCCAYASQYWSYSAKFIDKCMEIHVNSLFYYVLLEERRWWASRCCLSIFLNFFLIAFCCFFGKWWGTLISCIWSERLSQLDTTSTSKFRIKNEWKSGTQKRIIFHINLIKFSSYTKPQKASQHHLQKNSNKNSYLSVPLISSIFHASYIEIWALQRAKKK